MGLQFRNICGAFLGGVVGILISAYWHPWALPFGCLLGTVAGYWYDQIWTSVVSAFDTVESLRFEPIARARSALVEVRAFVRRGLGLVEWDQVLRRLATSLYLILFAGIAVGFFVYWMKHSGGVAACAFSASAVLFVFAGVACLGYGLDANPDSGFNLLPQNSEKRKMSRVWNRETLNLGASHYFAVTLMNLARAHVAITIFATSAGLWMSTAGVLFYGLVVMPIIACVGAMRGLYFASQRGGHWTCFPVTLLVTTGTAWLLYPHWTSHIAVWLSALLAGVASAGAAEAVRMFALPFLFEQYRLARSLVVVPVGRRSRWASKGFWRVSREVIAPVEHWTETLLPKITDPEATQAG